MASPPTLAIRPAELDEADFATQVWNSVHPDEQLSLAYVRYRWSKRSPDWTWRQFLALESDEPVGYGEFGHQAWAVAPERFAWLEGEVLQSLRTQTRLEALLASVEAAAREAGAEAAGAAAREDDPVLLAALSGRGFGRAGLDETRDLDLVANEGRLRTLAEESRARMRAQGVTLTTFAALDDPAKLAKLHACFVEAEADAPHDFQEAPATVEGYAEELRRPDLFLDRIWVAVAGDRIVGESELSYPDVGVAWTNWTGVARDMRNRGIARALKLETFLQAIDLGVRRVRTGNDQRNGPMVHINEGLGYVQVPGWVKLRKAL